jgi:hypothetical protein
LISRILAFCWVEVAKIRHRPSDHDAERLLPTVYESQPC